MLPKRSSPAADPTLAEEPQDRAGLAGLLELEDDPGFLEIACPDTGVLAWPAIRSEVFRLLLGDRFFATPLIDLTSRPNASRLVGGALRAVVHNRLYPPQQSEILLFATGAGLEARDGTTFNRYIDYFSERLGPRAWTIESLFGGRWPEQPRSNRRLAFLAGQQLRLAIASRAAVRAIHRKLASDLVGLAERQGRDRLGWDLGEVRRGRLIEVASRRLAAYPLTARFVLRLLRTIRPRLALVEEGCYGHMAVFNATAREHGLHVAELQHGMVTPNHDAYNVAPRLAASSAYRATQPASFLAYGRWWTDQFNAPVDDRVVIGNPHRTERLKSWRPAVDRNRLIVLGDGIDTEAYLALSRQLAALVGPPLEVLFRPHPLERARVDESGAGSASVDRTPDLYESLRSASGVIGEASTALFEAIGIVPRVFVWDTPKSRFYLGDHPFERFAVGEQLATMLALPDPSGLGPAEDIWADRWEERFLGFVDRSVA